MSTSFFLVADLTKRILSTKVGGTTFSLPTLTAGEQVDIGLNFSEVINGTATQITPNLRSLRASIGRSDAPPTGGKFALRVDTHVTATLPFTASASNLKSAIDAVLTGGVTSSVVIDGTSFVITFSDNAAHTVVAAHNDLDPICLIRVRQTHLEDLYQTEVTLLQAPIASSNVFTPMVPPAPTVTMIQTATEGLLHPTATIQSLYIPPNFTGTFTLSYNGNATKSLSVQDGSTQIQEAINAVFTQYGQSVTVTNPKTSTAQIAFDGSSFMGFTQPLLQVAILQAPNTIPTVSLDLNTSSAYEALRAADTLKDFYLEIVADIVPDNADPATATDWQTVTLCRVPVSIQRPINWSGLEAATPINWAQPPGPTSYIPYNPTQVITGQQFYTLSLGNGTANKFTITHGLNTQNVHLTLRENSTFIDTTITGARILINGSDYVAHSISNNSLMVVFPTAPANGSIVGVVSSAGPTSAFVEGLTISESQVIGLSEHISQLNQTVAQLQAILPTTNGIGVTANSAQAVVYPLSIVSELIGYFGAAKSGSTGYDASALPNRPPSLAVSSNFDRELWSVPMNSSILALGRKLKIDWGVALQALKSTCGVSYNLVVEIGNYTETGGLSVSWNTGSPVFVQPLVMTEEFITHSFGISISRLLVGNTDTLHLDQQKYGITTGNNAAAPSTADFLIRCRLIGLSTESSQTDPRAWISYALVPSLTAKSGASAAQASVQ
jgi:hypothetical protein